jgi:CheY-like chemotaxis protein
MSTLPTFHGPSDRPTTILCIDDERPTLLVRTAQLEAAGFRVFPALTANVAVELFVAHPIDVILSAMVLPGPSGADLSIFMRQVRPEVSVVLLAQTAQLHPALVKQVDACIDSDASVDDLLYCLRQVLMKQFARPGVLKANVLPR